MGASRRVGMQAGWGGGEAAACLGQFKAHKPPAMPFMRPDQKVVLIRSSSLKMLMSKNPYHTCYCPFYPIMSVLPYSSLPLP